MTSLYIANTTKQHHDFVFRRPEQTATTTLPIRAGQQVQVLRDVGTEVVDHVLNQHRKYGIKAADDAAKSKMRGGYVGLIYSVDKPVTEKQMRGTFATNDKVLKEIGKENLKAQVGATAKNIQDQLEERGIPATVGHLEVEMREEVKPGGKEAEVALGVEVARPGKGRRLKE